MSESCTVIIGAQQHLEALRERAGAEGEVLTFGDHEALRAFETITSRRPKVITFERLFAATSRGAALINRIKADPALQHAEIRVVSHDGSHSRVSPRRGKATAAAAKAAPPSGPAAPAASLDYRGTRRAKRYRMIAGTEVQVDGASSEVIDLSVIGAQIVSTSALRPQQRGRITLADDLGMVKFSASVAWAFFEIPKGVSRYRAGIDFKDAEPKSVDAFCKRHQLV